MIQKMERYRDAAAVPILIEALDDDFSPVRDAAARALMAVGAPAADAVPRLEAVLRSMAPDDDPAAVRAALEALRPGS